MAEPTVGRIVHYTDNPVRGGGQPRCRAAIVVNANEDGTVDLAEFISGIGTTPVFAVMEGEPDQLYRWHWPERAEH